MTMAAFRSNLAMLAQMAAAGRLSARFATVSTAHDTEYEVKVFLQPENIETNYLPVLTPFVGNGWGMFCKPDHGDQVLVVFADGDANCGVVVGGLFSDVDRPLAPAPGELWIVHKQGQFAKFLTDGSINAHTGTGGSVASLTLKPDGTIATTGAWTHTGTFHATGAATFDSTLAVAGAVSFTGSTVTHGGVNIGKTHVHNVQHAQGGSTTLPSDAPT